MIKVIIPLPQSMRVGYGIRLLALHLCGSLTHLCRAAQSAGLAAVQLQLSRTCASFDTVVRYYFYMQLHFKPLQVPG